MTPLAEALARRIRRQGPITVAEFMAAALSDPVHGYYRARDAIGASADFVTAPEISQMFGELIGLWCAETWRQLGRPDPCLLVELGPGRGTLIADALRAAARLAGFVEACHLHLVEASPVLRRQQAAVGLPVAPDWHDSLDTVPEGPTIAIANEFFDALPVRQFQKSAAGWHERLVGWDDAAGRLAWMLSPPSDGLATALAGVAPDAPAGSVVEVSPAAVAIARDLAGRLRAAGGAALIVDYGYARAPLRETLQAVRRHERADPLSDPGEVDLTAHVDFAGLADIARHEGIGVLGPVSQASLLTAFGIDTRADQLKRAATPAQAAAVDAAKARLTGADAMGHLFKALLYWHGPQGGAPVFPPS
ncbi:MAG: SAM-dependent methyltransferase [Rhodospirillaceae bacterium]|nr:SAM-dependent methyltransferase [Rhodospirillaceae bacterium]